MVANTVRLREGRAERTRPWCPARCPDSGPDLVVRAEPRGSAPRGVTEADGNAYIL